MTWDWKTEFAGPRVLVLGREGGVEGISGPDGRGVVS